MKRIKIMLTSLALVAVVGGALAFKANMQSSFCTAEPQGTGSDACLQACLTPTFGVQPGSTGNLVCTAAYNGSTCQGVPCVNIAPVRLTVE